MNSFLEFWNYSLIEWSKYDFHITVRDMIVSIIVYCIAFIGNWLLKRLIHQRLEKLQNKEFVKKADIFYRLLNYSTFILSTYFIIWFLGHQLNILNYDLLKIKDYQFKVFDLFILVFIYLATRILVWFTEKIFIHQFLLKSADKGKKFAMARISSYLLYILGVALALESIGVGVSIIWAGSAALLVGIGFGMQQTINDWISGIILLLEGTIKVGDMIELDTQTVGRVKSIDIRTSTVETRDSILIIIPNSSLIVNNVINWSRNFRATRFLVTVGVAYGSDVRLVEQKLIEAARKQKDVVSYPEEPFVHFKNFGDNSLEFELLFWTTNIWDIEIVKSDIRFNIDALFRENEIVIAFPQRDIHIKVDQSEREELNQLLENHFNQK